MSFIDKIKEGLSKTKRGMSAMLNNAIASFTGV